MLNYFTYPYGRAEQLDENYIIASYLVYGASYENILKKAGNFAVGQTIGTWVEVPGVSTGMVERYQGRVVSLEAVRGAGEETVFFMRLAFPLENFAGSFTMLLTALAGNDVSTAMQTKLVDLELCGKAAAVAGPKQGMNELRALTGVFDRPLVLNMIKPCTGFTPQEGAKLFYEAARGGVDLIKDDELLGSPAYNPAPQRVEAYAKAAESACGQTGKRAVYLPNISGAPKQMRANAKAVLEAGAKACLVNFVFGGLDSLAELCAEFGEKLFIMAHYAGVGVMNWERGGIANPVFLGLLPRLAGAHAVMTMHPDRADPAAMYDFYKTVQAQRLPLGAIRPVVTTVGGGVTPANQAAVQSELGRDCVIGIGGAIQGHPMGTAAGARAAVAAVSASAAGVSLEEAAESCEELRAALELWK